MSWTEDNNYDAHDMADLDGVVYTNDMWRPYHERIAELEEELTELKAREE